MTVLIAMFILGLSIGLGTWALSWSNHVKKELVVHVYFCTTLSCGHNATQEEENAVGNMLANISQIKSVNFVSKAEAFRIMEKKNPELTNGLPSNRFTSDRSCGYMARQGGHQCPQKSRTTTFPR